SAILLVKFKAPKTQTKDWIPVTEAATNYAASLGVTSVQDVHSDYQRDYLLALEKEGKLKTRVYDCTPLHEWKRLLKMMDEKPVKSPLVRIGCLKSFSDGFEESIPELYERIDAADKAGLQVLMHAIGNKANEIVLGIFERIENENTKRDRRFRVEHAFRFRFNNLGRYSKSNIIVSLQPHLFGGNEPYRSFLNADTKIAFGSDASITDFNPLFSIHAAVNRGSFEGGVKQALTVEEAVRFYTIGSAYAEFQEEVKGSIKAGKLADVIILSDDIFSVPAERIRDAKVVLTIVDGKVVYEAAPEL
ncbi:MAG: amidohydrolase family protein, partial [Pyrinomonadaceae bacterium]|nr:amidohydrolase family protein [Pyrinomonadaceae bacterium]